MPEIGLFTMVVMIVLIVSITKVLRAKYGDYGNRDRDGVPANDPQLRIENDRLRDEMRGLKERVAVLERIATDTNRSVDLDREIERLRDR